jgi:hypothetical protein
LLESISGRIRWRWILPKLLNAREIISGRGGNYQTDRRKLETATRRTKTLPADAAPRDKRSFLGRLGKPSLFVSEPDLRLSAHRAPLARASPAAQFTEVALALQDCRSPWAKGTGEAFRFPVGSCVGIPRSGWFKVIRSAPRCHLRQTTLSDRNPASLSPIPFCSLVIVLEFSVQVEKPTSFAQMSNVFAAPGIPTPSSPISLV